MNEPAFRSETFADIPAPDYADVQLIPLPASAPVDPVTWAEAIFSVRSAPLFVKTLLGLRQLLVPLIGVPKAQSDVFHIEDVIGEEALIAADDTHLDFRVGVGVDATGGLVRLTTVVRLHGWRGRLYFLPVRVLHGPITRAMMTKASQRLSK